MAYNIKYRCEFKDYYNNDIEVDILQSGWSYGNVTDVVPGSNPLTIEWPSTRGDIFDPVRGSVTTFNFYAEINDQFNEFFSGSNKDYRLDVLRNGDSYWSGWLMLEDYQESLMSAPYVVSVKAYDLGYLQNVKWDASDAGVGTLMSGILSALNETGLELTLHEAINIYEDSISSGTSYSMLTQINFREHVMFDDNWTQTSLYDALGKLLLPLNACVFQEWGCWHIVRITDMKVTHNYRSYAYPFLLLTYGSENITENLSSYEQINKSAILMAAPTYKKLNITQDYGLRNLVQNGTASNRGVSTINYWSNSGNDNLYYTNTYNLINIGNRLVVSRQFGTASTFTHKISYNVTTLFYFNFSSNYEWAWGGVGAATKVRIELKVVGASTYYLNMSTGAWSTTSSVSDISISGNYGSDSVNFTDINPPIDGVLSISFTGANWSTIVGNTTFTFNLMPQTVESKYIISKDLSKTISSSNLQESDIIIFEIGDTVTSAADTLLQGNLTIASTNALTDSWSTLSGSASMSLLEIARDCYRAQYVNTAKRIQATLRKDEIQYYKCIEDSNENVYMPSSISYNVKNSELTGEWIEIKSPAVEDPETLTFSNTASYLFDSLTDNGDNTFDCVYSNIIGASSHQSRATLNTITDGENKRYRVTVSITDNGSIGTSKVYWSWDSVRTLTDGAVYDVDGAATAPFVRVDTAAYSRSDLTIGITLEELYGY